MRARSGRAKRGSTEVGSALLAGLVAVLAPLAALTGAASTSAQRAKAAPYRQGPVAQRRSEPFEFRFEGSTLRGLIELPAGETPTSLVIIVPGSGRTDFVVGGWYNELRSYFVSLGMACCFWDKAGCGKSEGELKELEHPIERSADEVVAAIDELRARHVAGSERIGLWGLSRAGWVCPFVITKRPSTAFWISVSSPDNRDQAEYQLKTNLTLQGRSEREVLLLTEEYVKGESIFVRGRPFEEYYEATPNLRKDRYCSEQAGKTTRDKYVYFQEKFLALGLPVDRNTGEVDFIRGFKEAVAGIKCPVLAVFGERDSQVDWRRTARYYGESLGSRESRDLTIRTLPSCNHNMQHCRTGARGEDLSEFGWRACDGYYDAMTEWIAGHGWGRKTAAASSVTAP